jgi:hypothetical protein
MGTFYSLSLFQFCQQKTPIYEDPYARCTDLKYDNGYAGTGIEKVITHIFLVLTTFFLYSNALQLKTTSILSILHPTPRPIPTLLKIIH